jgi:hypothetical protein
MISHTGKAWGVLLGLLIMPIFAHAQLLTGFERPLNLTTRPEYPKAGDSVTLSVQSYGIDLDRSVVIWYADGKEIARGNSMNETIVAAGKLGSATEITVIAEEESGLIGSASATIRPAEVDLLWESDSYVPPYYRGRNFAGAESVIRAQAVVRFVTPDGVELPESSIVYAWNRGSTRIATGRGRSSVTFPGPALFGGETLTVTAESIDGRFHGKASARIDSVEPTLELYENHPLFGVLYHRALTGSAVTLEREQKVSGIPYFAHMKSLNDEDLVYEWTVAGLKLRPDPEEPQTLTVASKGYAGPVAIRLVLTSTKNWFLKAEAAWELVFSESGSIFGGADPFAPQP